MHRKSSIAQAADATGRSVITVRASSWGSLFDCAYRWQGDHLLGLHKPSGMRAQLGTAVHASTAAFDSSRLPGADPISVDDAAEELVRTLHDPEREVDMKQDDLTLREAEKIGLALHSRYCFELSPRFTFRSVEQKLQPLDIDCGDNVIVRLTGTMDRARVADTQDGVVIPDVKTGARVIEDGAAVIKGRSAQVGAYQLMYEQTEGVPTVGGQILALQTSGRGQVAASKVFDAKRVMLGTDDAPGLIEIGAQMFRTGLFPPNPGSLMCSKRYCSRWDTCPYHES